MTYEIASKVQVPIVSSPYYEFLNVIKEELRLQEPKQGKELQHYGKLLVDSYKESFGVSYYYKFTEQDPQEKTITKYLSFATDIIADVFDHQEHKEWNQQLQFHKKRELTNKYFKLQELRPNIPYYLQQKFNTALNFLSTTKDLISAINYSQGHQRRWSV